MYTRNIQAPDNQSFFLFGPRGTGKSTWLKSSFPNALYFDLLDSAIYTELLAEPARIENRIPLDYSGPVIIDEVQKVPQILDHVHRLIENRRLQFILTGSSARKLRRGGVNLLAGRAITKRMHPLSIVELGDDYDWQENLKTGFLPYVFSDIDKQAYLKSYISTYLKEEVQQEGLTRNLASFSRFIEAASFSQGSTLNISAVARDCSVDRKMVETYFDILEDLLIAVRIPVFTRKAKRRLVAHPKFYYFDCGVFQAIRPKGPLDEPSEIGGAALETLVLQQLRAQNDNQNLGYDFYYWRTSSGTEVDFVLYGPKGLLAFEVKLRSKVRKNDLKSLKTFLEDYPVAKAHLLYGGNEYLEENGIKIIPISQMGKHSIL